MFFFMVEMHVYVVCLTIVVLGYLVLIYPNRYYTLPDQCQWYSYVADTLIRLYFLLIDVLLNHFNIYSSAETKTCFRGK